MKCVCICKSSYYKIVDEGEESGGLFVFLVGEAYDFKIETHCFWGDSFHVTEKNTGFEIGLTKDKFDLHFKTIDKNETN